jgi:hypothetical protein
VLHGDLTEHARTAAAGTDVQLARDVAPNLIAAAGDLATEVLDRVGVHAGATTAANAAWRRGRRRRRTAAVITATVAVVRRRRAPLTSGHPMIVARSFVCADTLSPRCVLPAGQDATSERVALREP